MARADLTPELIPLVERSVPGVAAAIVGPEGIIASGAAFRPAGEREADPRFVEHLGGGAGFFNVMRIYPDPGVGAIVMGNATKYDLDRVARLAASHGVRE